MKIGDIPASEMHPNHQMKDIRADIWAENDTIIFTVELQAQSLNIAENYLRSVYPNISSIFVYEKD